MTAVAGVVTAASTTKTLSTSVTLYNPNASAALVSLTYKTEGTGASWTSGSAYNSASVPPGSRVTLAQWDDSAMPAGKGSAVVSSDQPLLSVVEIHARSPQVASRASYVGSGSGATSVYFPLVLRKRTGASGLSNAVLVIQNVGSASADVAVDLIPNSVMVGVSTWTKTGISIPAGASYYYDLSDENPANVVDNWAGSAVVRSTNGQSIYAVAELFFGDHQLWTYNGYLPSELTTTWYIPTFASRRATNGFSTPASVQNLSGATIAVGALHLDCVGDAGKSNFSMTNTTAVANNQTYGFNPVTDMTIPADWGGSCKVTAPGSIAVVGQLRFNIDGQVLPIEDQAAAYKPAPGNVTGTRVVFPVVVKNPSGFSTVISAQNMGTATANVTVVYTPLSGTATTVNTTIAAGGRLQLNQSNTSDTNIATGFVGSVTITSTNGQPLYGFSQLKDQSGAAGDTLMAHEAFTINP